jgi:glycosyltransferase involved in cell wall biosynthesis
MRDQARSLSIVIPYYNEELNIERSLQDALDYLRPHLEDFEIIAVDDCSTDRTLELARRLQATEPRIKIVHLETNSKFAGALKKGFAAATKDYVFYTDGDCPIDYEDLDRAFAELDRYDVVIGARVTRDKEGLIRKFYTKGYRLTLILLLGLRFHDINFSFKLFPRQALRSIEIESDGSFIDAEILYKLQKRG